MSEEFKQNDGLLRESEEKYKLILENANDLITIINENLEHEYINEKAYFDLLGYSKDDIIGKTPLTPLHPDDVKIALKVLRDGFKFGEGRNEMRVRHKDGHYLWLENKGKTFIDIDGKKKAILISRDITERKIAEQKIKESETKYRLISENANDLILILKQNLNIEYVNENPLLTLTGNSIDEVIGKRALNYIHLDDAKKVLNIFSEAFNKEGHGTIEVRIKHKMGHFVYVEINVSLFHNKKGEPRALLITRDITERKKVENNKLEEYKKLEESSQIKSESIMIASHELKTPLSSVYFASQILLKNFKEQLGEEVLNFLEIIYRGSQKLKQLIENMLDASSLESNELNLNLDEENLVEIINDCISDLKHWADKRNLNIKTDLIEQFILEVDRIRIEQVICNLLSNAIKYTPPNGNIQISLNDREKYIEISIKDTGIGLTKKEKEKLFQKFGKIERFRKQLDIDTEGTGLGLYISKEIVELHKGKIIVKSQGRNKGSTFIIRLPK
ncbi:MAG: PAS domain-containing sensor histidine kinase [Candidatus Lokiarchaeia archaeon]